MTDDQEIAIAEVTALKAVAMARKTEPCLWCDEAHVYTGFIYRWVHRVSGKWYLGSHYGCLEDGYIGSGVIFKKALDKHGVEAFNREIIALTWCTRRELLNIEEEILIAVDARGDQMSYNTKNKGLGQDPEVCRAIFLGREQTEEHKAKRARTIEKKGLFKGLGNGRAQAVVNLTR
jgi:hypothetical protein